ncbi:hypothetical protein PV325_012206 [Microctonus aethiopoides]|nr:hypothetical protein PV325_012206 [Microctonus aethiopoides]
MVESTESIAALAVDKISSPWTPKPTDTPISQTNYHELKRNNLFQCWSVAASLWKDRLNIECGEYEWPNPGSRCEGDCDVMGCKVMVS